MPKPKLPKIINTVAGQVTLTHVGGWNRAGQVVCTYERVLEEGVLEVISPKHLYHGMAGRDLYPTQEQMDALRAGQRVRFGTAQWA